MTERLNGRRAASAALALAAALLAASCGPRDEDPTDTAVSTVDAQYCAFAGAGKAYVSAFDSASAEGGIYTFRPAAPAAGGGDYLYMTDTYSGSIYAYDPGSHAASSASFASTARNATGEIAFHEGIGYVSVGSGAGAGVYRIDPTAAAPSAEKIAEYRPIAGTTGTSFQEMVVDADGFLYAANLDEGAVLKIDTSSDAIVATVPASAGGTTGLATGSFDGVAGVFVANTGGYDESWSPLPGSVDFIASGSTTATTIADALPGGAPIHPARLVQLPDGNIIATGYGHTYRIVLSGGSAAVSELTASGSPFGGLDIAYRAGLVYVPCSLTGDWITFDNRLYVFDEGGAQQAYSPVAVMGPGDSITNIGFYED